MTNKNFPVLSKDEVLKHYAAYTHITDSLWLVRDGRSWALYDPDMEMFLSPFMYREFEHPNRHAPDICCLYTDDRVVRYHTKEQHCLLR